MKRIKDEKGMITVEVVLGLTVYVAFFVILLNLINIIYLRQKFQAALRPVALEMSRDYEFNSYIRSLNDADAAARFVELQDNHFEYFRDYAYHPSNDLLEDCKRNFRFNIYERNGVYLSNQYITDMGVVNGFNGIDFSGSYVDANTGELDLEIKYQIRILRLPFFEDAGIDMTVEQHACTRLWY